MVLLRALVRWGLANRAAVLVATLVFAFFGLRGATRLPIDAVPDVTNVQVQIITAAPALSPVEVEQYVTVPVERAMSGIPHVTDVRSISKYGVSVVTVVFTDETDLYFARQLVAEHIREAEENVPPEYGRPEMAPISSALGQIFQFAVEGDGYDAMQLKEELDSYIGPQLRQVDGVVEVNAFGGETKQYQVVLDPERLQASGFSVGDVVEALGRANGNAGGGYIEHHDEQLVIGTDGLLRGVDDIRQVVVGTSPTGAPVTIDQLADHVGRGAMLRRGASSIDGRGEIAVGIVMMLVGANSRTVTEGVKAKLREIEPTLPKGMHVVPFYDRAALVDRTIHTVAANLLEGAALVVVVLFLLLGSLRAGVVVALVIPLAMLFAILMMNATGTSGNLMSLGALDFGLIVDGAVIIVENAVRRLGEAQVARGGRLDAVERVRLIEDAAVEMMSASIFGQAIIAIVYVPILGLEGIEGKLFHPMALTVLFALAGAFVASVTVVPILASLLLRGKSVEHETWIVRAVRRLYAPALRWVMQQRAIVLAVGVVAMIGTIVLAGRTGAEFVPRLDEGDLLLEARRLPGVALSQSLAIDARMQRAILSVPEVAHVVSETGSADLANDPMGIEQADVYVILEPRDRWPSGVTKADIAERVGKAVEVRVPDVAFSVSQPIEMRTNELIAGVRSDVAVEIYGQDLEELQRLGDRIAGVLSHVPGAVDVRAEQGQGLRYLRIVPDRAALARRGLTVADVNRLTEAMAVGTHAGLVFEGERRFAIVVKVAGVTADLETLRSLPLRTGGGQVVPLGDVAGVYVADGPGLVNRNAQSRRLTVEFNVRGRDLVSVADDARAAVSRSVTLPPGYRLQWGGQFENFLSARRRLEIVLPLTLALIGFLLWLAFQRWKPALLVFVNVPFAAVGGVVALSLRGIPFSISAAVGFIALFGVAVLNGLVLMSACRALEAGGMAPHDAIRSAALGRLRPVLMTALVAALGFLPMAVSTAPGSEVQRPLATVVIGGLVTATVLTLFLFPAVYSLSYRKRLRPASAEPRQ